VLAMGGVCAAHALGLGEIEVKSHLNEPLSATIPLTATARELESLVVELAGNEEFERAGLERAEFLSQLSFEIKDRVVVVTSRQAAREPFIGFLLDVRWSSGRLLREYIVLLDPPTVARPTPAPAPVVSPVPLPKPVPVDPKPQPVPPPPVAAPAMTPDWAPAVETEAPKITPPAEDPPAPALVAGTPGTYGPVQPQETLWSIAYRLRPDPQAITMDQMQLAIFRANPKAFDGGRITGLMAGAVLRIPDRAEILAVDVQDARMQMAAARSGITPTRPAARPSPRVEPRPAVTPEPKPVAPAAAVAAAPEPAPGPTDEPAAEMVDEDSAPMAPDTVEMDPVEAEAMVEEPSAAMVDEAMVDGPAKPLPAPEVPVAPDVVTTPLPVAEFEEPSLLDELMQRATGLLDEPLFLPVAAGFIAIILLILGLRKVSNLLAERAYKQASKPGRKVSTSAVGAAAAGGQAPSAPSTRKTLDELASEDTQAMTGAAAATIAGMGASQSRTEAAQAQTQAETQAHTLAMEASAAQTGGSKVDFDVTGQFASETVQINLDAGDPLSEAEFHRAYGLYDEAALLLKQALQKNPEHNEARIKLAEIYFEAGKTPEFMEVARELKQKLPAAQWQPIALMGTQIAPSDALFKDAGGAGLSGGVDLSFDEPSAVSSAPTSPEAAAETPAEPAAEGMLDFRLEEVQLPADEPETPKPAADAGSGLEFDLGELSLDSGATASAPAELPATGVDSGKGEALDFTDFDLGAEVTPEASAPAADAPAAPADEAVLDLGEDFGLEAPQTPGETPAVAEEAAPVADEAFDLGGAELPGELSLDESQDLTAGDEASTKLDLARAYMDMGDNDMARSLLGEVMEQGNDSQKKEAQDLLQRVPA
jgi:pilus assembly protein FimV